MSNKVYLVDGSGYIFRAYFAVAPLSTRGGFPTNALFGFTRMMKKLLKDVQADHLAVAFDVGRETFRLAMYPEYKANRVECPEDLKQQMPHFRELVAALGVTVLELPGYEADDIIGTLAQRLAHSGQEVVIVSGDKDLTQLVTKQITVYDPMHERHFDEAGVQEKFGVRPDQIVDLLALMGDSSDNVPGLDGVGPKTAAQLVEKFGDVTAIINSAAAIRAEKSIRNRQKIADQIEHSAEKLRLSKKLVEIKLDTPVLLDWGQTQKRCAMDLSASDLVAALARVDPDQARLADFIKRFEFSTLFEDFNLASAECASGDVAQIEPPLGAKYRTVLEPEFDAFLSRLEAVDAFALDLETTSLSELEAQIVGASFCWSETEAYYVPLQHKEAAPQVALDRFLEALRPLLRNPDKKKSGQNLKYDIKVLLAHGLEVEGVDFDSMIAAYLLNPDRGVYNLTVLANEILNLSVIEYEQVVGEQPDFSYAGIAAATRYSCQDVHYVWLLKEKLLGRLSDEGLLEVASEIDMPLVPVLARMEVQGIALDTALLKNMSLDFEAQLKLIEADAYKAAGGEFNLNSPKQLSEILFEKLKIPTKGLKRTKSGVSTDWTVLEKLSSVHPLPAKILEYRSLAKLKSTYIDALPAQISPRTGRLHTRFNQAVTGTGRLSSSDPNLQNIPVQGNEGGKIRSAFIAAPGKCLISADYSQIELRLLAHMSGDKNMLAAFQQGVDIHAQTAREILGIMPGLEVSSSDRRLGKTINFGIVYGMGGFRLARDLGISVGAANSYIERYFSLYSGVKQFFDQLEREALAKGEVRTLFGRRRLLADIDSSGRDQGFVLRAALNAPIQGSAADVVKRAMVQLDKRIKNEHLPMSMLLQIHDELVFECPIEFGEEARRQIRHEMENAVQLSVRLEAEVGMGANWQEAKG